MPTVSTPQSAQTANPVVPGISGAPQVQHAEVSIASAFFAELQGALGNPTIHHKLMTVVSKAPTAAAQAQQFPDGVKPGSKAVETEISGFTVVPPQIQALAAACLPIQSAQPLTQSKPGEIVANGSAPTVMPAPQAMPTKSPAKRPVLSDKNFINDKSSGKFTIPQVDGPVLITKLAYSPLFRGDTQVTKQLLADNNRSAEAILTDLRGRGFEKGEVEGWSFTAPTTVQPSQRLSLISDVMPQQLMTNVRFKESAAQASSANPVRNAIQNMAVERPEISLPQPPTVSTPELSFVERKPDIAPISAPDPVQMASTASTSAVANPVSPSATVPVTTDVTAKAAAREAVISKTVQTENRLSVPAVAESSLTYPSLSDRPEVNPITEEQTFSPELGNAASELTAAPTPSPKVIDQPIAVPHLPAHVMQNREAHPEVQRINRQSHNRSADSSQAKSASESRALSGQDPLSKPAKHIDPVDSSRQSDNFPTSGQKHSSQRSAATERSTTKSFIDEESTAPKTYLPVANSVRPAEITQSASAETGWDPKVGQVISRQHEPAPPESTVDARNDLRTETLRQVQQHIHSLPIRQGSQEITVKLHPETLGEVKVTLTAQGDQIAAKIQAQSVDAHAALTNTRSELRASLEEKGFVVRSLDITPPAHSKTWPDREEASRWLSTGNLDMTASSSNPGHRQQAREPYQPVQPQYRLPQNSIPTPEFPLSTLTVVPSPVIPGRLDLQV